jgi:hypothetical protein
MPLPKLSDDRENDGRHANRDHAYFNRVIHRLLLKVPSRRRGGIRRFFFPRFLPDLFPRVGNEISLPRFVRKETVAMMRF